MSSPSASANVRLASPSPSNVFTLSDADGNTSREMVDAARAAALLQPLTARASGEQSPESPAVDRISLAGKSLGLDAARLFADALRSTPSLTHADLSDCIASRPTDEALETLQVLCEGVGASGAKLRALDLSNNAVGVRGIPRIAGALRGQEQLEQLFLNNDGLQAEALANLTELVMANHGGMEGRTNLRTLEVQHNCLEDAGFLALIPLIERSPLLETLRIATTRVRNDRGAGLAMARTLLQQRNLRALALNDNNLGSEAGEVLAQVVRNNAPHWRELVLGDVGVEEEGIIAILRAMRAIPHSTLHVLDLAANELSASQRFMRPLCRVLRAQAHSLRSLKLEDNELRSRGLALVLSALSGASHLRTLNLNNTAIGSRSFPALLSFVRATPSLRELLLNSNRFKSEELEQLKEMIEANEGIMHTFSDNEEEDESDEEEPSEAESETEDEQAGEQEDKADAEVDALAGNLAKAAVADN